MNETEKAIAEKLLAAIAKFTPEDAGLQPTIETYRAFLQCVELRIGIESPNLFGTTAMNQTFNQPPIPPFRIDPQQGIGPMEILPTPSPEPGEPHAFVHGELGACTVCGKSSLSHEPAPAFNE